jgi:hypothetical protein
VPIILIHRHQVDGGSPIEKLAHNLLIWLGEIALYYYGDDSPKLRRRISALMHEVARERRLPFFKDGGRPASRKSWLDEYTRRQAENLPTA